MQGMLLGCDTHLHEHHNNLWCLAVPSRTPAHLLLTNLYGVSNKIQVAPPQKTHVH